jgi:hypothetical protein
VPSESLLLSGPVGAHPDGVCPTERPADIQRSGVVAVLATARTPAMASVAGRCPASGVHPSAIVVRVRRFNRPVSSRPVSGHLGSSSGGPAVRSSAVHPSSPLVSTRPASSRLVSAPRPSGRFRLLPHRAVALGIRSVRRAPLTTGTGRVPVGCRAVERLGRRPSRPGRGRCCRGRVLVSGVPVADPGRVRCGRRWRRLTAERPGLLGVRSARGCGGAVGTGAGCSARWPHQPRGCQPGLDARPRCVVVVEPDAPLDGPGRAKGLAGGMGVRPQRGPGWQPGLPARCQQASDLRRWVVGLPGLEPGTSS